MLAVATLAGPAAAQWSNDPAVNTPVCTAPGAQLKSVAVSDGAGGVIVAWADNRGPAPADIYAQRFDPAGNPMWTPASGVAICTAISDQDNAAITSDGAGGAIISWDDYRSSILAPPGSWDTYAQRVDASGVAMWAPDGVLVGSDPVAGVATDEIWSRLIPDGAGGAFLAWESGVGAFAATYDIYAQRLDATGASLWAPGGIPICAAVGGQFMPMLVESGTGAIITWYDGRGPTFDIYAQGVTDLGAISWAVDGIAVCAAPGDQLQPMVATDGAGGAIITWYDSRFGALNLDVFAQHVLVGGALDPLWPPLGLPICTVPASNQQWPKIVSDDAGGAIITWYDARSGVNDIYAQRVTGAAAFPWGTPDGVPVCTAIGDQDRPKIVTDGAGGAIVAWRDERSLVEIDVFAQRLDGATGAPLWTPDGVAVCLAPLGQDWWNQHAPMIADGWGGAILTWTDPRMGPPGAAPTDIYAQRINDDGTLGGPAYLNRISFPNGGANAAIAVVATGDQGSGVLAADPASLARFDASGAPQWVRSYSLAGDEFLSGTGLARLPDGWVASATVRPTGIGPTAATLLRLDEDGDVVWARRNADFSEASAVVRASDGGIVLTGWSVFAIGGGPVDAHAFLTRFDADGTPAWTTYLDSPVANARPSALVETLDGGYAVAGIGFMNPYERLFLARFDGSGSLLWARAFTVGGQAAYGPIALDRTPDGGFVLGASLFLYGTANEDSRLAIVRFDADGALLWSNSLADGRPLLRGAGIVADATGAYLTGGVDPGIGIAQVDAVVIRAGSTGAFEWQRRFSWTQNYLVGRALALAGGGVLMAGSMGPDLLLAQINAGGQSCLGTLSVPSGASLSIEPVDPQLSGSAGAPTYQAFDPAVSAPSSDYLRCVAPLAVAGRPSPLRVESGAIGVRLTSPAADRMTCRLALPRALALQARWFDLHGRRVGGALDLGHLPPGEHALRLERPAAGSGIYLLEVSGGGLRGVARAVLLK